MNSGAFLQSPEWEKFQNSLGRKTWRIDDMLVIKMPLKFGFFYLYAPKGASADLEKIKKITQTKNAVFFRFEPQTEQPKKFIKTKDVQPRCTLITDISQSENEILAAMHPKTRYNLRLAARKKLRITNYELRITEKNFDEFYNLLQQTASRQKIRLHSKEYYKKLLNCPDNNNLRGRASYCNEIFIAYHENKPVASAMVNFYQDTAAYLHGGSDEKYKNLMAPYLLHWEIIKTAKSRGFHYYDWWGIDEKKWPGITRFKLGFGGEKTCAPGAFDLPLNKILYFLYKLLKKNNEALPILVFVFFIF